MINISASVARLARAGLVSFLASAFVVETCGAGEISVVDVAGREVKIETPAKRVLLGEGRQLLALGLIHPDPVSLIAAWPGDLKRQDEVTYAQYVKKFPALETVPVVGRGSEATFSVEQAIAAKPDVAILSGGYGPSARSTDTVRQLEAAGIQIVFIDFVAEPLKNTIPSMRLLGQILGREQAAQRYIDFYQGRLDRIRQRLANAKPPTILMHAHAGLNECCNSPGRANIGAFIDAAGGHNIATDVLKTPFGQLQTEYVITRDPEVYVGTGGIHLLNSGLVMGPGIDAAQSRARLREIVERPEFRNLSAVRNGRVFGLWHLFNNLPMNILAIELLAKWFHPELFADIDPDQTLRQLNAEFLPVPMNGTYWVSLGQPR